MRKRAPASASHPARVKAHRWGWSLRRADSRASSAAPAANANSTAALITFSRAPPKTTRTRTMARRIAARRDTITIQAILRVEGGRGVGSGIGIGWLNQGGGERV